MKSNKLLANGLSLVFGLLVMSIGALSAFAQASSTVRGTVVDPQGRAVAGATVTLTNAEKSYTRMQTTNEEGGYVFNAVPPGTYAVEAEAHGFKRSVVSDVQAQVNQSVDINIGLEIGSISERVEISAGSAAPLNTTDATVGNNFTERQILDLPLEGRNVAGLLSLQPGVTYFGITNSSGDTTDWRNGSVNGGKSDQANVTLDGVDVNDQQNQFAFTSVLRVTLDSVEEFRVTTTNPNAEQGRSSGAQVGLITKSGTNEWHGSAYEFHRNTVTTANTFFNNMSGIPRPKLLRNVFGGMASGPILKDRFFIFFNYEGRRDAREASVERTVPSAELRQGNFRYNRTGGGIGVLTPAQVRALDPAGIGPNAAVLAVFQQYPLPNVAGGDLNFQSYRFNSPISLRWNTYIARLDYNITSNGKHVVSWRGNLQNDRESNAPQFPGQSSSSVDLNNSKGMAINYIATLTSTLTNSLRYGFTRQGLETTSGGPLAASISFQGLSDLFSTTRGSSRISPVHNFVEDLAWIKGTHSFQFGGNIRLITNSASNFSSSFPFGQTRRQRLFSQTPLRPADAADTAGNDAMTALLGLITLGRITYNYDRQGKAIPIGEPLVREFAAREYEWYAQDTWRVRPNLTLSLGVRHSIYSPPYEKNGVQVAPTISLGEWFEIRGRNARQGISASAAPRLVFDLAGRANNKPDFYDTDMNNFAPRLALAYSPGFKSGLISKLTGGPGNTSIRAGYALVYDRIGAALATRFSGRNLIGLSTTLENPAGALTVANAPRFTGLGNIPQSLLLPDPGTGFPLAAPANAFQINFGIDRDIKTPYSIQADFAIARQLPKNLTLEVAYVGRFGKHLLIANDVAQPTNLVDPRSGMDYFTAVNQLIDVSAEGAVPRIPFWENLFPALASSTLTASQAAWRLFHPSVSPNGFDFVSALARLDTECGNANRSPCGVLGRYAFFNDQYSSLITFQTIAPSNYNAMQITFRKRFSQGAQFDANYTLSKAMDWASRAERDSITANSASTVNAWDPWQRYAPSDFDVRHNFNFNGIFEIPVGRGKRFASSLPGWANAIVGGWQLSGIWRWTSGLPTWVENGGNWPTNWNFAGGATATREVPGVQTTRLPAGPNLFTDPAAAFAAYTFTRPGQSGQRNNFRGDGYFSIDMNLSKRWVMPYSEKHILQFRWEVFNLTNTARFDPFFASATLSRPATFGRYSDLLTQPRIMQFGLRYQF